MSLISTIANAGPALIPALAGLGGAVQGSRFIQEGQRGVKVRFGKVVRDRNGSPKIRRPGFVFILPAVEHLVRTHVRTRTLNLEMQQIMLTDRMVFEVGGMVQIQVKDRAEDIYAALFETDDLESTVCDYVAGALRDVVSGLNYQQVLTRDTITSAVKARITGQLCDWGLDLIDFALTDCSPTPQTARAILLGAEAVMRAEALSAAAQKLSGDIAVRALSPTLAAALIGTPVATALNDAATMKTDEQ